MKKHNFVVLSLLLFLCLTACAIQSDEPIAVDETITRHHLQFANADSKVYDYSTLASCSDVVVVADIQQMTNADRGFVMPVCKTVEILKGTIAEEFVVCDSGVFRAQDYQAHGSPEDPGVIRDEWTMSSEPLMRNGNRVLLFLVDNGKTNENGKAYFELAIGPASKFFFDPADDRYHNALLYSKTFQEHITLADASLYYNHSLTDMTPKSLEEFKTLITSS